MDRKLERNFFSGPFNPKYKDINLFDSECYPQPIKAFHEIKFDRALEREEQVKLIKKYKKEKLKFKKFYK